MKSTRQHQDSVDVLSNVPQEKHRAFLLPLGKFFLGAPGPPGASVEAGTYLAGQREDQTVGSSWRGHLCEQNSLSRWETMTHEYLSSSAQGLESQSSRARTEEHLGRGSMKCCNPLEIFALVV
jgi:hypothetical protein